MKRARVINAAIWAVIGLALTIGVVVEWHQLGCGIKSLILGALFYTAGCTGLGAFVDEIIREHNR